MAEHKRNQVCYTTLQYDEPWTYENYLKTGGYKGWQKILDEGMSPADVVEAVKESGLRGRGGAGFPTGLKWSFMPKPVKVIWWSILTSRNRARVRIVIYYVSTRMLWLKG